MPRQRLTRSSVAVSSRLAMSARTGKVVRTASQFVETWYVYESCVTSTFCSVDTFIQQSNPKVKAGREGVFKASVEFLIKHL